MRLQGRARSFDFEEKSLDDEFLDSGGLPEDALGMEVEVEVLEVDGAGDASFFEGLQSSGLTVREMRLGGAFGKGPLTAAAVVDQEKLDVGTATTVAHGCDLQGQSDFSKTSRAHG